jgi:hypothetical protein
MILLCSVLAYSYRVLQIYKTINAQHSIAARQVILVDDLTQLFQELSAPSVRHVIKSGSTPHLKPVTPISGPQNPARSLFSTPNLVPTTPGISNIPSTPFRGSANKIQGTPNYHASPLRGRFTPKREQYLAIHIAHRYLYFKYIFSASTNSTNSKHSNFAYSSNNTNFGFSARY